MKSPPTIREMRNPGVCDKLEAVVTDPDRYDPGINRSYQEMAGRQQRVNSSLSFLI